jgi:hypothetical protein
MIANTLGRIRNNQLGGELAAQRHSPTVVRLEFFVGSPSARSIKPLAFAVGAATVNPLTA